MAAIRKVQVILTKYFMCINWGHYMIYLQNMKFERLILWPGGAYTDTMHRLIHESWLHRLIGKYPKWAKNWLKIKWIYEATFEERIRWLPFAHADNCISLTLPPLSGGNNNLSTRTWPYYAATVIIQQRWQRQNWLVSRIWTPVLFHTSQMR